MVLRRSTMTFKGQEPIKKALIKDKITEQMNHFNYCRMTLAFKRILTFNKSRRSEVNRI